jgi:hypothetical protein
VKKVTRKGKIATEKSIIRELSENESFCTKVSTILSRKRRIGLLHIFLFYVVVSEETKTGSWSSDDNDRYLCLSSSPITSNLVPSYVTSRIPKG